MCVFSGLRSSRSAYRTPCLPEIESGHFEPLPELVELGAEFDLLDDEEGAAVEPLPEPTELVWELDVPGEEDPEELERVGVVVRLEDPACGLEVFEGVAATVV